MMFTKMPSYAKKSLLMILVISTITMITYLCVKCMKSKTSESFSENSNKTLIFFKATWCGHCNRFKPVWDEFVSECQQKNEQTNLLELDIDNEESKPLMEKHNVRGFPHVVLVEDNRDDIVFTKNRTKEDLLAFLNEYAH